MRQRRQVPGASWGTLSEGDWEGTVNGSGPEEGSQDVGVREK